LENAKLEGEVMDELKGAGDEQVVDVDAHIDTFFESNGEETAEASPAEVETTGETEVKEVSEEPDLDKKGDTDEADEIPKEFHKHPRWQQLLQRAKSAESKASETEKMLEQWQSMQEVMKSPEYVRTSMKSQGYTDEAISNRLREMGHVVEDTQPDVFALIKKELGIDPSQFDENYRVGLSETEKVVDLILKDRLNRLLPTKIEPITKQLTEITRKSSAGELVKSMRETVKTDGVLDFDKDIAPTLDKYISENPKATQEDLARQFERINHSLSLQVLRQKGKRESRDETKKGLTRAGVPSPRNSGDNSPERTGDFLNDAYSFLEHIGYKE